MRIRIGAMACVLFTIRISSLDRRRFEGYDQNTLERTVKANTEATVSVYLPLPNSAAQARLIQLIKTTLSLPIAQKVFSNFVRLGQFAYGLDVTLADGRTLRLGTRR